jgi:hypothetical protein
MSERMVAQPSGEERSIGRYITRSLYNIYAAIIVISVISFFIGIYYGDSFRPLVTVPVILILINAYFVEKRLVRTPPLMIFILLGLTMVVIAGRFVFDFRTIPLYLTDCLFGIVLGLCGQLMLRSFAPSMVDVNQNRSAKTLFVSFSLAISLYLIIFILQYYLGLAFDAAPPARFDRGFSVPMEMDIMMEQLTCVIVGALLPTAAFQIVGNSSIHRRTMKVLDSSLVVDIDEYERTEIERAIKSGESEVVEYKSTLKTDLQTGKAEDRIERTVLMTIVAFLNSKGGVLLIGVADDGAVLGLDESFDNRDRALLHLTNMIKVHIGHEFFSFISYRVTEYNGKDVMRVVCTKSTGPVFLKEWPQESFIVRSGASSLVLEGTNMLNYVDNHFKKRRVGKGV